MDILSKKLSDAVTEILNSAPSDAKPTIAEAIAQAKAAAAPVTPDEPSTGDGSDDIVDDGSDDFGSLDEIM